MVLKVEGYLQKIFWVNIERQDDVTISLTQPHMIDQVMTDMHIAKKG